MTAPKTMKMSAFNLASSLGLVVRNYKNKDGNTDPTKVTIRTDGKSKEQREYLAEFIRRAVNLQVYRRKDKRVTEGNNNFFAFFHKAAFDKVSKVLPPPKPKPEPKAKKQPKGKKDTALSLLTELFATIDVQTDCDCGDEDSCDADLHSRIGNFLAKQ
jgi:hypothetical protein